VARQPLALAGDRVDCDRLARREGWIAVGQWDVAIYIRSRRRVRRHPRTIGHRDSGSFFPGCYGVALLCKSRRAGAAHGMLFPRSAGRSQLSLSPRLTELGALVAPSGALSLRCVVGRYAVFPRPVLGGVVPALALPACFAAGVVRGSRRGVLDAGASSVRVRVVPRCDWSMEVATFLTSAPTLIPSGGMRRRTRRSVGAGSSRRSLVLSLFVHAPQHVLVMAGVAASEFAKCGAATFTAPWERRCTRPYQAATSSGSATTSDAVRWDIARW